VGHVGHLGVLIRAAISSINLRMEMPEEWQEFDRLMDAEFAYGYLAIQGMTKRKHARCQQTWILAARDFLAITNRIEQTGVQRVWLAYYRNWVLMTAEWLYLIAESKDAAVSEEFLSCYAEICSIPVPDRLDRKN